MSDEDRDLHLVGAHQVVALPPPSVVRRLRVVPARQLLDPCARAPAHRDLLGARYRCRVGGRCEPVSEHEVRRGVRRWIDVGGLAGIRGTGSLLVGVPPPPADGRDRNDRCEVGWVLDRGRVGGRAVVRPTGHRDLPVGPATCAEPFDQVVTILPFLEAAVVPASAGVVRPTHVGACVRVALRDEQCGVSTRKIRLSGIECDVQRVIRSERQDHRDLDTIRRHRPPDIDGELDPIPHLYVGALVGELGVGRALGRLLNPGSSRRAEGREGQQGQGERDRLRPHD